MKFRMMYAIFVFGAWLCFGMVFGQNEQSAPLGSIVPRIAQEHFKLEPMGQQYMLVIQLPDGSSRTENVELRAPNTPEQELHFMGTITNLYPEGTSVTMYEAGRNGYTVKYRFKGFATPKPTFKPLFLSPNALKSSVG